jgi:N-acyl amino acid synthase of PEP-CTERM/exosortase system
LRVVLPNDEHPSQSFSAQEVCDHPLLQQDSRALTLCEISRFCMAKNFRKRELDGFLLPAYYDQDMIETKHNGHVKFIRRKIPYAPLGLLAGAFESALTARITDCVWMVEPRQLWSLKKIGLNYRVLGPHIDHHGGLQPVIFNIKNVLDSMHRQKPNCWEVVSEEGRIQKMADDLQQNDWQDALIDDSTAGLEDQTRV